MKTVFADSHYWIAVIRPNDSYGAAARDARKTLGDVLLLTTDEVLTELLAGMSKGGNAVRLAAVAAVRAILNNPNVRVLPQTRDSFSRGVNRYEMRPDKQYSLTDCISMNAMENEGVREVLINDHHFKQEGMVVLIEGPPI